jgi:hypothetical protein
MAISTYSELQTAANNYSDRSDSADRVKEWIALFEARANRELGAVETDTTLTGTLNSRRIDLSAVAIEQPIALFLAESGSDEVPIPFKTDGTFPYLSASGVPTKAGFDVSLGFIDFDCPLNSAYPFRLRFRQRFALSDSATTNWLLTKHPDLYLAGTMMWGAGYREDLPMGQVWKQTLDEAIPQVRHVISQGKRATASIDPALSAMSSGRRSDNSQFFS